MASCLSRWLLHSIFPLFIGGSIYLLFRPDVLLMFRWVETLHFAGPIGALRENTISYVDQIPAWCLFSLPAACWTYSLMASFRLLWQDGPSPQRRYWLCVAVTFAISSEIGQLTGYIPGHFEALDIASTIVAIVFACITVPAQRGRNVL